MNKQEMFDRVVSRLRDQGEPAYTRFGCAYETKREGKSLRCAVGHLLDTVPQRLKEGNFPAHSVGFITMRGVPKSVLHNLSFVTSLQVAHDRAAVDARGDSSVWRDEWLTRMRGVACDHNLDVSVLDETERAWGLA